MYWGFDCTPSRLRRLCQQLTRTPIVTATPADEVGQRAFAYRFLSESGYQIKRNRDVFLLQLVWAIHCINGRLAFSFTRHWPLAAFASIPLAERILRSQVYGLYPVDHNQPPCCTAPAILAVCCADRPAHPELGPAATVAAPSLL